jgi:ADP-heptose:LPS heptosyltransferase
MNKILIIRFSSIGDIVLTTPVIRALHNLSPRPEIHFITKSKFRATLEHNPYLDKIYTFDKEITEIANELKSENYSLLVDLHFNIRSKRLKLMLGVPSIRFDKLNYKKWLRVKLKYDRLPKTHIVDRYLKPVLDLGAKNDGEGLDYFITDKDRKVLEQLPERFNNGYHALVIGGAHFTKQIPKEILVQIAQSSQLPLVLLGGVDDIEKANLMEKELGDKVWNSCGLLTLNESAAVIEKCEKVVTSDTGIMHIASAFDKEILSLWGNTIPGFGMYPYFPKGSESKNYIFQVNDLSCRPCSKIGFDKCPKKHFKCMLDINIEEVVRRLNAICQVFTP